MVKTLNKALDVFRSKLRREQPEVEGFKDINWDLFKAKPTPACQAAFAHSPLLRGLWALGENFHLRFASATNPVGFEQSLTEWIAQAKTSRQHSLIRFTHTLYNWHTLIANFAHQGLTNADINNVICYVKCMSYGLPNFEHHKLRVLAQAPNHKNCQRNF